MIFKQVFRVAFVTLIWKQYKSTIVSSLLLLAFLLIVSNIHSDYLTAVGPDKIDQVTFIYKWLAYTVGILVFLGFHLIRGKWKATKLSDKEKIAHSKESENEGDDPFAEIRKRDKLRSRADFLMDQEKDRT